MSLGYLARKKANHLKDRKMDKLKQELDQAMETLNPVTLEQRFKNITGAIDAGMLNPLDAIMAAKKFEKLLATLKKDITETVITEMLTYNNKFEDSSGKIEVRNGAGRWDYKHISKWVEKKNELTEIEEAAKLAAKSKHPLFDNDGCEIEPAKYTEGKETVYVTLKK